MIHQIVFLIWEREKEGEKKKKKIVSNLSSSIHSIRAELVIQVPRPDDLEMNTARPLHDKKRARKVA